MNFQIGFQNNISSLDNSVEFNRVNKNSMNYFGDFVLKRMQKNGFVVRFKCKIWKYY